MSDQETETQRPPAVKFQGCLASAPIEVDQTAGEPTFEHSTFGENDPADPDVVAWLTSSNPPPDGMTNGDYVNKILAGMEHRQHLIDLFVTGRIFVMKGDGKV